ncbi:hypothetical protein QQ045_019658 [Rhodiola kirilowii]
MSRSAAVSSFSTFPSVRQTTPWNTQLRELAKNYQFRQALTIYRQLLRAGDTPNAFTFPFALKSCAALSLPCFGAQLHSHITKTGCQSEPFVLTSLISMYCKSSHLFNARQVFDESCELNRLAVCYNAIISGYVSNSGVCDAVMLFDDMRRYRVGYNAVTMLGLIPVCGFPLHLSLGMCIHCCNVKCGLDKDSSVGNCLLTMYVRCGYVEMARRLFDEMGDDKELITWNAMISGYAQNGLASQVLDLYKRMDVEGIHPDAVTYVGVLSSCANLGAQIVGCEVERRIQSSGLSSNPFLKNALINMHVKCGNLVKAHDIFESMSEKTLVSWTAMIGGYGVHGQGEVAVKLFNEMISSGVVPDRTAFVCVLSACSHAGLSDRGLEYFKAMKNQYKLHPGPEHYSCVVDLLGRVGKLKEARELIESMPVQADGAVWGALLGACKIHKNIALAEIAFQRVIEHEPTNIGYYVLLSNIYADAGNVEGLVKVRVMMRERKLKKEPGYSYVEHKGKIHLFISGDREHPQTEEIYRMLANLEDLMTDIAGRKSSTKSEQDAVQDGVRFHSEKLAAAFGLLNTDAGTDVVIIKNLRICGDCHLFMTLVSKIVDRQLIVRDATRFHHFKNGVCSCKEHW